MDVWSAVKLLGGLGLFLYGLKLMSESIKRAAGDRMRRWLQILTANRFAGAAAGLGITAVLQSSSATTVMVVGLVDAGLMTEIQAAGVIMGANAGTTATAWIVSIQLETLAPLFVFAGLVMMFIRRPGVKKCGGAAVGFGLLFLGMDMMSAAMLPLKYTPFMQQLLVSFENPLSGILAGALITALLQSSSATASMLISLAMADGIALSQAACVILGANLGTCVTALLAGIGAGRTARRAALFHLLFNVSGVAAFAVLMQFVPVTRWVAAAVPEVKEQIALFHTIFNVFTLLLFIGCPQPLIRLTHLMIRGRNTRSTLRANEAGVRK